MYNAFTIVNLFGSFECWRLRTVWSWRRVVTALVSLTDVNAFAIWSSLRSMQFVWYERCRRCPLNVLALIWLGRSVLLMSPFERRRSFAVVFNFIALHWSSGRSTISCVAHIAFTSTNLTIVAGCFVWFVHIDDGAIVSTTPLTATRRLNCISMVTFVAFIVWQWVCWCNGRNIIVVLAVRIQRMVSSMPRFMCELTTLSCDDCVGDGRTSRRHVAVEVRGVVEVTEEIGIIRLTTFTFRHPFSLSSSTIATIKFPNDRGCCSCQWCCAIDGNRFACNLICSFDSSSLSMQQCIHVMNCNDTNKFIQFFDSTCKWQDELTISSFLHNAVFV